MASAPRSTRTFETALERMIESHSHTARIETLDEVLELIKSQQDSATGEQRIALGKIRKSIAKIKHIEVFPSASKSHI